VHIFVVSLFIAGGVYVRCCPMDDLGRIARVGTRRTGGSIGQSPFQLGIHGPESGGLHTRFTVRESGDPMPISPTETLRQGCLTVEGRSLQY
jgi:hypothetical protein